MNPYGDLETARASILQICIPGRGLGCGGAAAQGRGSDKGVAGALVGEGDRNVLSAKRFAPVFPYHAVAHEVE